MNPPQIPQESSSEPLLVILTILRTNKAIDSGGHLFFIENQQKTGYPIDGYKELFVEQSHNSGKKSKKASN